MNENNIYINNILNEIQNYDIDINKKYMSAMSEITELKNKNEKLENQVTNLTNIITNIKKEFNENINNLKMELNKISMKSGIIHTGELNGNNNSKTIQIKFNEPFEKEPSHVILSTVKLDTHHNENTRYNIKYENLNKLGFDIIVSTWLNTIIFGLDIQWTAFS